MTDNEAISEFLNNLSVLKGYSDNTIDSYKVDLMEFLGFLKSENMASSILKIRKT